MHPVLKRNVYFVKEHTGALSHYDMLDPETQELVLTCRETTPSTMTKVMRYSPFKRKTPFEVKVTTPSGDPVLAVKRGTALMFSRVEVLDEKGARAGSFQENFGMNASFAVLDASEQVLSELVGKFSARDFRFVKDG